MPDFVRRCRPRLEALEARETPAVTATSFASVSGGAVDSILIRGGKGNDTVQITDTGSLAVLANGAALTLPVANPVVVRVTLQDGNDLLEYLVPTGRQVIRQIEYAGGAGRNSFEFSNVAGGKGAALLAGSILGIKYDGVQGKVQDFVTRLASVTSSVVNLDYGFGAGNDRNIVIDLPEGIENDSSFAAAIDLGSGSTAGSAAAPANTMSVNIGNVNAPFAIQGLCDISVLGGAKSDGVDVQILDATGVIFDALIGDGAKPSWLAFHADLGGGHDRFNLNCQAEITVNPASRLAVGVRGGAGNDQLSFAVSGPLTLTDGSAVDFNLAGNAGNDVLTVTGTGLITIPQYSAMLRLQLSGNGGNDQVTAQLNVDVLPPPGAQPPQKVFDVQVLGGSGNDVMGLTITDIIPECTAILDGGLGSNSLAGIGVSPLVTRFNV